MELRATFNISGTGTSIKRPAMDADMKVTVDPAIMDLRAI